MKRLTFEYDRGVHLAGSILWFDAARHDVMSVVSSARVDAAFRHSRALCTERTRALLRATSKTFQALVTPFGRRLALGPLQITLLPSGFMPGAAQALIESDGGTALYASNAMLDPHPMAEAPQFAHADVLVVKAAYGRPAFAFPPRAAALAQVVDRARATLSKGFTPVFLCSPIGKAQEVVRALTDAKVPVCVPRSVAAIDRAYHQVGVDPGRTTVFKGAAPRDSALVFPDRMRSRPAIQKLKRARLFWLSGRAAIPDVLARMRVDEGILLAGHLDHLGLLKFVERTKASRVYTVGAWAEDFAATLRARGIEASSLYKEEQLALF
jgi:putative mRNA 3-end processing factor